ncbi:hypothetical protein KIPB_000770 [Kipferlia bialata]|uniref:Uncharacterized protein n=1 Tax=Kipferlia bialata TaxID=797122 RepID=A0A9K3CMW6_9EUKA|nr:hypothetical protein KIPB_000770 [Kipferlia bialata]|eukprot:g770.t1
MELSRRFRFQSPRGGRTETALTYITTSVRDSLCDISVSVVTAEGPCGFVDTFMWSAYYESAVELRSALGEALSSDGNEDDMAPCRLVFEGQSLWKSHTLCFVFDRVALTMRRVSGFHSIRKTPILRIFPRDFHVIQVTGVNRNDLLPGTEADRVFTTILGRVSNYVTVAGFSSLSVVPQDKQVAIAKVHQLAEDSSIKVMLAEEVSLFLDPYFATSAVKKGEKPLDNQIDLPFAGICNQWPAGNTPPLLHSVVPACSPLRLNDADQSLLPLGRVMTTLSNMGDSLAFMPSSAFLGAVKKGHGRVGGYGRH